MCTNTVHHKNDFDIYQIQIDEVVSHHAHDHADQWQLLRKLNLPYQLNKISTGTLRRGLIVDVETTGLSLLNDEVIQIGLLPFTYDLETGLVLTVEHVRAFEGIREPSIPISEEASLVSGLTKEMLVGKKIDDEVIENLVNQAEIIIAHNAEFDRVMAEKHWPAFATKPWGCSFRGVDWLRAGFSAGKLDYLGYQFGWFYNRHRVLSDCEACLALLAQTLPSGKKVFEQVRLSALEKEYLVSAVGSSFDLKDLLKERGYRWRGKELHNGGTWWTVVSDLQSELDWLNNEIYGYKPNLPIVEINAVNRYSERIWSAP